MTADLVQLPIGGDVEGEWETNLFVNGHDHAWLSDDRNGDGLRVDVPLANWKPLEPTLTCCFGRGLVFSDPVSVKATVHRTLGGYRATLISQLCVRS